MMNDALNQRAPYEPMPAAERPVGEIVSDLWQNTEKLVRQEMQLGLTELDERVDRLKTELMLKAVGGVVLLGGFLAVVASIILLLSKAVDPWISALIVGVVMLGAGYFLEQRKLMKDSTPGASLSQKVMEQGHSFKEAMK
jgi:hypothetical protein